MRRFEIVQSDTDMTTSHSGLALVGRALRHTRLAHDLDAIPLRHGIAHADCVKSYIGLLCTGKSDFDAIETGATTRSLQQRSASPECLRHRACASVSTSMRAR